MIEISIASRATEQAVKEISDMLDDLSANHPYWKGVKFNIKRYDFSCVSNKDNIEHIWLEEKIVKLAGR
ncbi:hypothetical protein FIH39_02355 [Salmonella enterica subsp. enterica]|uniref:hypothetical protein n=1 Tax=Salmonella enterica TaxID=28901 RepID=UPI000F90BE9F|nr:hypothetical protein [Salmonella enterica]EAA2649172.1 hypothetical protein [Salmonella enterica subsp. enterica serovar Colorado]EBF9479491.1 hypothetical protein [Salmonella enterica subsp. enterica serovar Nigeria]EBV2940872.1 hypothetical protein [Salmonella enterica subsp. enterica serovar Woodhull]EBW2326140.1 hypothetical protein [Salmonella enterica subsp. enterica serovar Agoueve]ECD7290848.1 hypothetical protein [Salmonella enterica subsp. enterica serovar Agbeni]ECI6681093.1 hyp